MVMIWTQIDWLILFTCGNCNTKNNIETKNLKVLVKKQTKQKNWIKLAGFINMLIYANGTELLLRVDTISVNLL